MGDGRLIIIREVLRSSFHSFCMSGMLLISTLSGVSSLRKEQGFLQISFGGTLMLMVSSQTELMQTF
jgi:hypothetical protein